MTKQGCLNEAIGITKEWCSGGAVGSPAGVLEDVYKKLIELTGKDDSQE